MGKYFKLCNVCDLVTLLAEAHPLCDVLMDTSDNGWIHLKVGEKELDIVLDD